MPETLPDFDVFKYLDERFQIGFKIIGLTGLSQIEASISYISDVSARNLFAKVLVARLSEQVTIVELPELITNAIKSLYSDLNVDIDDGAETDQMKSITPRQIITYLTRIRRL